MSLGSNGNRNSASFSKEDFEWGPQIGEGAYSQVVLATLKPNTKCAIKIIEKQRIKDLKKEKTIRNERDVLLLLDHPNVIKLICTFHDEEFYYFALEFAPGGDLHGLLKGGPIPDAAQFYAAEIVLGLEHMHKKHVIHRDMKPENVLLSDTMHAKITDFGTAKVIGTEGADDELRAANARKGTFCGTAEYVSPEILSDQPATIACDLWALGCILFQMISGEFPFKAPSQYLIFQRIKNRTIEWPDSISPVAKDLIDKLMQIAPEDRIGANGPDGFMKLKAHPYFKGIDWININSQTPPIAKKSPKAQEKEEIGDAFDEKWQMFMCRGEEIVYTSLVKKRSGISIKTRQLILTTSPRLVYVDPQTMAIKGTIPWNSKDISVVVRSPKHFNIVTRRRTYIFQELLGDATTWATVINKVREMNP